MTFASPLRFFEKACNVTCNLSYFSESLESFDYFMPLGQITPFLIESSSLSYSTIYLKSAKSGYIADVTSFFSINSVGFGIYFQESSSYGPSTLVNVRPTELTVGSINMPFDDFVKTHGSVFYLVLANASIPILYSDIFAIKSLSNEGCDSCEPYFSISWSSDCNVGDLRYADIPGLNNKVFVSSALSKPEYQYEEEGSSDGRGEFFPKFQSIKKVRKAEIYGTEGFADALAMIPLHSIVHIEDNEGNVFSINRFLTDVSWRSDSLAIVSISATTAFTTKNNCCQ